MLKVWTQDCMTRIFANQKPPEPVKKEMCLHVARNEVGCFQIGAYSPSGGLEKLRVKASDLVSASGEKIAKEDIDVLFGEYVPVHWHSAENPPEDLEGEAPGFYPDPLLPFFHRKAVLVQFPPTVGIWVRIRTGDVVPAGSYRGSFEVSCKGGEESVQLEMQVWPFSLPKRSHLLMSNWLKLEHVLKSHNLELLSDHFWRVIECYARNLSDHRQNVILTPLFHIIDILESEPGKYVFDFHNFDRWVKLFFEHGFEEIEGSRLAHRSRNVRAILMRKPGQDQAEYAKFTSTMDPVYRNFLRQFLIALRSHLQDNGWLDRFHLFISDEPIGDEFEAYTSLSNFIKSVTPEIRKMEAVNAWMDPLNPEDVTKYAPYIDIPVMLEDQYEEFVETSGIPRERIWFYYCCGPVGPWPNRFLDFPLIRVRIFTWIAFRYGAPGFLHWGLNHWDWLGSASRGQYYNPYDNTTVGGDQAGDGYVLYPPWNLDTSDNPVDSIRWEIIRKAMEDYEYLYMLREIAESGDEQAKGLLEELKEKIVPNFTEHTRDPRYLEDFRLRMGQTIANAGV